MIDPTTDPRAYRHALGRFATGIALATTWDAKGQPQGVTINSFSSVSLTPPLVLFSLGLDSRLLTPVLDQGGFGINVLGEEQRSWSERFADEHADRHFSDLTLLPETRFPLIEGCLATFDCTLETRYEGGDHLILIGRVHQASMQEGQPLVYFSSRYAQLA
jgi:flavin reductase (DIM6/NTAB) family NADH-FMN oxidoreductase RutF